MPAPKLTPARSRAILAMIADGIFIETACAAAGVNSRTYRRWMVRADEPGADPRYAAFRDAANVARATAEANAIRVITNAGKLDARHAEWFLERSFPNRYGRQTRTEVTGKNGESLLVALAGLEAAMGLADPDADS